MATTPLRGFECSDRILIPVNEAYLLSVIKAVTSEREYVSICKSIISIRQKLNVAMYQAALIYKLNPNHFTLFHVFRDQNMREVKFSEINYKICSYSMGDVNEYLLALAFFIDTFAATIFSLFDVSGSLINQLYKLNIKEDEASFHKALSEIQLQGCIDSNDSVFRLLCSYTLSQKEPAYRSTTPLYTITWLKPIKSIRNRTTHRPITEICDFESRGDIHSINSGDVLQTEFFLNEKIYSNKKKLSDFVKEVFDGIEEYVEDLYFYLREAVQRSTTLPIY